MKYLGFFFFFLNCAVSAQQTVLKKFEINTAEIEISTEGLDQIILENSEDNFATISLNDENVFTNNIIKREENNVLQLKFKLVQTQKEPIFRKFITERLNRATAKIKIPKNKNLVFLGNEIDIISKNYQGNISIFIDKGEIKLAKVKGDVEVRLYSGNVSATVSKTSLDLKTTNGNILIDGKKHQSEFKKEAQNSAQKFTVKSIKANIVLRTLKTQ